MIETNDVILGGFIGIMVGNSFFQCSGKDSMADGNDIKLIARMTGYIWEL